MSFMMNSCIMASYVLAAALLDDDDFWRDNATKKRRHKYWVRPWIKRRRVDYQNTFYKLQKELLKDDDMMEFRSMLRMDCATYTFLLEKISGNIKREDTQLRKAISPAERLSVTLNYLAFGM